MGPSEPQTMPFTLAPIKGWEVEQAAGARIMQFVRKIDFPLKLDNFTCGEGNCMIIAILQQCQREDILQHLPANIKSLADQTITREINIRFRLAVRNFVMNSGDERIKTMKTHFEEAENSNWSSLWEKLVQDKEWGDDNFLHSSAIFLNVNIKVISTSNTRSRNTNAGRRSSQHHQPAS